jgi:hypothetical protein
MHAILQLDKFKHSRVVILMTGFSTRSSLHQAPLNHRKVSHLFLLIPPVADASKAHTESCGVISGVSRAREGQPTSQLRHRLEYPQQLR